MPAKNYGYGFNEFTVTPTLLVRVTFSDSVAQNPTVSSEQAAKHLRAAADQIEADAAKPEPEAKPKTK